MQESAFLEKISEVTKAEKQKKTILEQANSLALQTIKEGQLKAQKIIEDAQKEAVQIQDELLALAEKEAQEQEAQAIKKAQAIAAKVREKGISKETAKKLGLSILK